MDGQPREVQPKVFNLLCYLIEHRERVIDKDELLDKLWAGTVVTESSLSQSIRKARALVGDDGNRQEVIRTVQRRGYRFVARLERDGTAATTESPSIEAQDSPPAYSIAVMPFANMSAEPENAYIADGISEELLNLLARIPQLRVAARTSSFALRDSGEDARDIGRRLKVGHLIEGSVRKAGNRVRVTVQLIETSGGYHLDSRNFDRTLEDIFALQDDIAAAVVRKVAPALLGDDMVHSPSINADAYTLYLQGRHQYRLDTPESYRQATALFEQAIALDGGFAPAWDLLGMVLIRQADIGVAGGELHQRGRGAVEHAAELDPTLPEVHSHLAWIAMTQDWDFSVAGEHIERGLALAPNNATVLTQAGALAFIRGDMAQSVALRERALALDPVSRGGHHNLGSALLNAGRADESQAMFRRALDIAPDYIGGWFYCALPSLVAGDPAQALELFARERDRGWGLEGRAMALHSLGQQAESDAALAQLIDEFGDDMIYQLAEAHAWCGYSDEAFDWLQRAFDLRDVGLVELKTNPLLAALHEDPRWAEHLDRLGLFDVVAD